MNADSLYQLHRDDAFADQFSSATYETFLAMPFSSHGVYDEPLVRGKFHQAHETANQHPGLRRSFSQLRRVDEVNPAAIVITDEIIRRILYSHFFVADLTGNNHGVLIEVGLALALKPNGRVLLFSQDPSSSLHFDMRVTNVNRYTPDTLSARVADALIHAAATYEAEADRYVSLVSSQITPDAISALNCFGQLYRQDTRGVTPSIWEGNAAALSTRFRAPNGAATFHAACRELLAKRLFWTHYEAGVTESGDAYGIHATKLGWRVIETIWDHDQLMRMPAHAITGPNSSSGHPRFATLNPRAIALATPQ